MTKGVLFHSKNVPVQESIVAMAAAVRDCGFELVDNPPYSLDLGPSDFFLFPNNAWLYLTGVWKTKTKDRGSSLPLSPLVHVYAFPPTSHVRTRAHGR